MMSPVAREDVALVARTDEVRTLTDALRAAGDARPGVWLVAGDAGVGKSRLVRELSERARSSGALVLAGQCVDLGGAGLPYLPFAEALGQAAADPTTAAAFDGLTALGPLLGRGGARHDAGDDDRLPLFDAVHTALGRSAPTTAPSCSSSRTCTGPTPPAATCCASSPPGCGTSGVLVVATYRSDDLHRGHPLRPLLGELPRLPVVERIDLAPFSTDELGRYLGLLRGRAVPRQVVLDMHRRTDGNAYFAEELLAAALTADGGRPDGLAELPWTLTDVLTARLDQLTPGTQQLVRVASVAGRRVTDALLLEVAGLPAAEVEVALREAVAHQVLVPDEREGYRFRHALLREAVYNDLLPGERVRTHARFAAALAGSTERGAAAALAHHHLASNDLPGAFAASLRAADEADALPAPTESLRWLEQALQLWDAVPAAQELAGDLGDLELRTAATAGRSGAFSRAVALSESARRRAEDAGAPHRLAVAERNLAVHLYNADRDAGGRGPRRAGRSSCWPTTPTPPRRSGRPRSGPSRSPGTRAAAGRARSPPRRWSAPPGSGCRRPRPTCSAPSPCSTGATATWTCRTSTCCRRSSRPSAPATPCRTCGSPTTSPPTGSTPATSRRLAPTSTSRSTSPGATACPGACSASRAARCR